MLTCIRLANVVPCQKTLDWVVAKVELGRTFRQMTAMVFCRVLYGDGPFGPITYGKSRRTI